MKVALLFGGVAFLIVLLWRLGPAEVLESLNQAGWYVVPALIVAAAHHAVRALALKLSVVRSRLVPFRTAFAIRLSGEAVQTLTFTGPVLAEPTQAWLLEARGLSFMEGFAATLTEFLTSTFVAAALSMAGLIYLIARFDPPPQLRALAILTASVCAAYLITSAIAIAKRFHVIGMVIEGLVRTRILRGRFTPDIRWVHRMEDLLLVVLRDSPARFVTIAALELVAEGLLIFELFWILRAFGVAASGLLAFVIDSSANVFEFVFAFVPLQVGVSEGVYSTLFHSVGLPVAAGFATAFLLRVISLVISSVGVAMLALASPRRP